MTKKFLFTFLIFLVPAVSFGDQSPVSTGTAQPADIYFLNVGQGDGTLIVCPGPPGNRTTILFDFGSSKHPRTGMKNTVMLVQYILTRDSRKTLDYFIISHGDIDHFNQFMKINSNYTRNTKAYLGGFQKDYLSKTSKGPKRGGRYLEIMDRQKRLRYLNPFTSATTKTNHHTLRDLCGNNSPLKIWTLTNLVPSGAQDNNTRGLAVNLQYTGSPSSVTNVFLTGDMTTTTETDVLKWLKPSLNSTNILKVAHHGSNTSTSFKWLTRIKPRQAIISSRRRGKWNHPNCSVLKNLTSGFKSNISLGMECYPNGLQLTASKDSIYSTNPILKNNGYHYLLTLLPNNNNPALPRPETGAEVRQTEKYECPYYFQALPARTPLPLLKTLSTQTHPNFCDKPPPW